MITSASKCNIARARSGKSYSEIVKRARYGYKLKCSNGTEYTLVQGNTWYMLENYYRSQNLLFECNACAEGIHTLYRHISDFCCAADFHRKFAIFFLSLHFLAERVFFMCHNLTFQYSIVVWRHHCNAIRADFAWKLSFSRLRFLLFRFVDFPLIAYFQRLQTVHLAINKRRTENVQPVKNAFGVSFGAIRWNKFRKFIECTFEMHFLSNYSRAHWIISLTAKRQVQHSNPFNVVFMRWFNYNLIALLNAQSILVNG